MAGRTESSRTYALHRLEFGAWGERTMGATVCLGRDGRTAAIDDNMVRCRDGGAEELHGPRGDSAAMGG